MNKVEQLYGNFLPALPKKAVDFNQSEMVDNFLLERFGAYLKPVFPDFLGLG